MGRENRFRGDRGEALAADYLAAHGFRLVARNYRSGRREIDLVAEGEGYLVFVEVKLRRGSDFGPPQAAVDGRKQRSILICARAFLRENRAAGRACRFDVLAVHDPPGGPPRIDHFRDAFRPGF